MRYIATVAALLALAGCATTSGLPATESRSGYDGARVVTMQPHGGACSAMICPGLGAQWQSTTPERAIVTVRVSNAWTGIVGARLMVDGQETVLHLLPGSTSLTAPLAGLRESSRDFTVPMSALRALASAGRGWLRVSTTDGSIDVAIVDGATDSKALHAMRRFLAQVDGR